MLQREGSFYTLKNYLATPVFNSERRQFIDIKFVFVADSCWKYDKNLFVKGLCLTLVQHLQGDSLRTWLRQQPAYHLEISLSYKG